MSSVEYDVLVKLRVDRAAQKGLGDSVKPLAAGLAKAERDRARAQRAEAARQKAAGREFLQQQLASERAIAKGIAARVRADKAQARVASRDQAGVQRAEAARQRSASREALREQMATDRAAAKGIADRARAEKAQARAAARDAVSRSRAEAKAAAATAAMWKGRWSATKGGVGGAASAMGGVGTGPGIEWAAKAGAVIGAAVIAALSAGVGAAVFGGIHDNIKQEQFRGQTATALQLFDFNGTDAKGQTVSAADQFAENLSNAKWYQQEFVRIADASPGDQEQVGDLFSGLLPGMASVTQDADRIVALTQKATLLSGVLGNRFKMVGEQSSRIITGGAGAEMDTWRLLQKPIKEAGEELGAFKKDSGLFGEKLTMSFNKLDPAQRLAVFEKGLEKLGPEVAAYFENSFEGITAQASSSLKTLRKELGRGGFEALKTRLRDMNKGGILNQKSAEFGKLKDFAGFLGDQIGRGISMGLDIAENAAVFVANHWQDIVEKAQIAGHYLKSGAELAVSLMAARAGGGAILSTAGGGMNLGGGVIGAITGLIAMGPAALVAAPAILAFGVVAGGAALIFGGAIAYIVANLDTLTATFEQFQAESGPVIDAFWTAVDDLSAKFLALGEYFIGPADETSTFSTATSMATRVVYGVTEAFSWLLGATADVVEGFGSMMDQLSVFVGTFTGNGPDYVKLGVMQDQLNALSDPTAGKWDSKEANYWRDEIAKEEAKGGPKFGGTAKEAAASIRAGKLRFDLATATRPDTIKPDIGMYGNAALGPQKPNSLRANPKPPKVNVKVTNHNHWNVRDVDPNAIVAAHNKNTARSVAVPLNSALALARRSGG